METVLFRAISRGIDDKIIVFGTRKKEYPYGIVQLAGEGGPHSDFQPLLWNEVC